MLHLAAPIIEDEPVAEVRPPVEDKATIDRREINRRACKHFEAIRGYLCDWKGRSVCRHLGPGHIPQDPSKPLIPVPTLREFRGPLPWTQTTEAATTFLNDLTDRLVEIKS
jgi:hypothetical protein